jgi:LCP family protein required for cell wall assembly
VRRFICFALALLMFSCALPSMANSVDERKYLLETISLLEPEQIPANPSGVYHYLFISMDKWQNNPNNPGYNDGLVLITLDEIQGRIMVTSIIRDLLVIRPDGNPGRINHIVREYGVQGLLDTINRHFGLQVDKYVLMDWRHIMEIVDACGGVNVRLTSDEVNYLKGWSVPVASTQPVLNGPGQYHLNGFASVIYMRIRKRRAANDNQADTQDFGRTFRVRTVLSALATSLRDIDMGQAQQLLNDILRIWEEPFDPQYTYPGIRNNGIFTYGAPRGNSSKRRYDTNITMMDLMDALRVAFALKERKIEQCRLPFDGTVQPFTYAKGAGQLADFSANRQLLHDFMFPESFVVSEDP